MQHIKEILPGYTDRLLAKKHLADEIAEFGYNTQNHTIAQLHTRPDCDLCGLAASYDAKCKNEAWGYLCQDCFDKQDGKLGLGLGQKLIIK